MLGDRDSLIDWIRLDQTKGVGPGTARKLLSAFGLPANIFEAGFSALSKVVPERVAHALLAPPSDQAQALIDKTLAWCEQPGNRVFTLADADYPKALFSVADPPLLLYAKGRFELLSNAAIAMVGSRNATEQGMINAERFAEHLSQAGFTIASGMALGIDTAAHHGGLRHAASPASGSTIAVIGTGIDIVYPARNRALAHRIAEQGCIVSEYPLSTPAVASNFPRRNRIISGLTQGVLVVEAAAHSGSLITARTALEQGREVFAIPGSIHSPLSKGCHLLIKQGAKLVESATDILEEFGHRQLERSDPLAICASPDVLSSPNRLLSIMGFDPVDANLLAERADLDAASLNVELLTLEMQGLVEVLPGGICRRLK